MLAWSVGSKRWIINQAGLLGPTVMRMRARVNNNGYVNKMQWHTIYLPNDTSVYNNAQPLLWLQHTINFNLWLRQAAHFWLWNSAQVLSLAQVQRQYSVQVPSISIQYFFSVSVSVLVAPSIQYQYSTVQYVLFSSGKLGGVGCTMRLAKSACKAQNVSALGVYCSTDGGLHLAVRYNWSTSNTCCHFSVRQAMSKEPGGLMPQSTLLN